VKRAPATPISRKIIDDTFAVRAVPLTRYAPPQNAARMTANISHAFGERHRQVCSCVRTPPRERPSLKPLRVDDRS
jgi:hypothetical protein